jgi:hypothetical protein
MDDSDRTCSTSIEILDQLVAVLRTTADEGLERACDNGGEWDENIRAAVLDAARLVETFDLNNLTPTQIADLANKALKWSEPPESMPTTMEQVGDSFSRLGIARELIKLRDRARHLRGAETGGAEDE